MKWNFVKVTVEWMLEIKRCSRLDRIPSSGYIEVGIVKAAYFEHCYGH